MKKRSRLYWMVLCIAWPVLATVSLAQADAHKAKSALDNIIKEFPGLFWATMSEYMAVKTGDKEVMGTREAFVANAKLTDLTLGRSAGGQPQASFKLRDTSAEQGHWEFTLTFKNDKWIYSRAMAYQYKMELTLLDNDSGPFLIKALARLQP